MRDQNATLEAVEGRGAQEGDYAVISFVGSRDGEPFEGGTSDRMPLILGQERLIPGFESNLLGLEVGGSTEFDITFPDDYAETELAGKQAHFAVELGSCARRSCRSSTTTSSGTLGDFADLDALRADVKERLERNALDSARHDFADKIIDYAVANATVELPAVLVDQEVEVMHDEFRATLARQGITEEAYLKAIDQTEPTSTPSSGPAPRSAFGPCSSCPRSPIRRASTSPTPRSRPRSRAAGSAIRTTRGCRSTSAPSAAAISSAALFAEAGSSRA